MVTVCPDITADQESGNYESEDRYHSLLRHVFTPMTRTRVAIPSEDSCH